MLVGRITPAYAGKTHNFNNPLIANKDHPRLRGENILRSCDIFSCRGSPPPTRGKPELTPHSTRIFRITPAYAGKTFLLDEIQIEFKDHPRLRGENRYWRYFLCRKKGSPPPTRGKRTNGLKNFFNLRITPAYAGKTACSGAESRRVQDHPRLRGENGTRTPVHRSD